MSKASLRKRTTFSLMRLVILACVAGPQLALCQGQKRASQRVVADLRQIAVWTTGDSLNGERSSTVISASSPCGELSISLPRVPRASQRRQD